MDERGLDWQFFSHDDSDVPRCIDVGVGAGHV